MYQLCNGNHCLEYHRYPDHGPSCMRVLDELSIGKVAHDITEAGRANVNQPTDPIQSPESIIRYTISDPPAPITIHDLLISCHPVIHPQPIQPFAS